MIHVEVTVSSALEVCLSHLLVCILGVGEPGSDVDHPYLSVWVCAIPALLHSGWGLRWRRRFLLAPVFGFV